MLGKRFVPAIGVAHFDAMTAVVLHHEQARDVIHCVGAARQSDESRVEPGEIFRDVFGCVIFGVYGYEQDLHAIGGIAQGAYK